MGYCHFCDAPAVTQMPIKQNHDDPFQVVGVCDVHAQLINDELHS